MVGDLPEFDSVALELVGQRARPGDAPVGNNHPAEATGMEVPGGQLDGLSGADQESRVVAEIGEHLSRHAHGGECHGDRAGANIGVCAHLLGHRERLLEKTVKHRARRTSLFSSPVGVLHLAENLWFAEDGRIQSTGNGECVSNGTLVVEGVEAIVHAAGKTVIIHQPFTGLLDPTIEIIAVKLSPIARGYDDHFLYGGKGHDVPQGAVELGRVEGHLLPKLDRRRPVIDSEYLEWHSRCVGCARSAQLSIIASGRTRSAPYRALCRYGILALPYLRAPL
jgi:hypothetical protein